MGFSISQTALYGYSSYSTNPDKYFQYRFYCILHKQCHYIILYRIHDSDQSDTPAEEKSKTEQKRKLFTLADLNSKDLITLYLQ